MSIIEISQKWESTNSELSGNGITATINSNRILFETARRATSDALTLSIRYHFTEIEEGKEVNKVKVVTLANIVVNVY